MDGDGDGSGQSMLERWRRFGMLENGLYVQVLGREGRGQRRSQIMYSSAIYCTFRCTFRCTFSCAVLAAVQYIYNKLLSEVDGWHRQHAPAEK